MKDDWAMALCYEELGVVIGIDNYLGIFVIAYCIFIKIAGNDKLWQALFVRG